VVDPQPRAVVVGDGGFEVTDALQVASLRVRWWARGAWTKVSSRPARTPTSLSPQAQARCTPTTHLTNDVTGLLATVCRVAAGSSSEVGEGGVG